MTTFESQFFNVDISYLGHVTQDGKYDKSRQQTRCQIDTAR